MNDTPIVHELVLTRLIDAPRAALFRCWTDAELLKQWFAPLPWTTSDAQLDIRPGGASRITMRSPEGVDMPNQGVFLEVIANKLLVFTDAFGPGWVPSEKPFMTAIISFADEGGQTRYTAKVRHWNAQDMKAHEEMGFHTGWGQCTDQLAALAKTLI